MSLAQAITNIQEVSIGFACFDDIAAHQLLDHTSYLKFWLKDKMGTNSDLQETLRVAYEIDADSIVLDSYAVTQDYFSAIRNANKRSIYFEDMLNLECGADVVINGLIGADELKYTSPHKLLGPRHLVLSSDYWHINPRASEKVDDIEIIVTTGGIDHYDLSTKTLTLLNKIRQPIHLHIVVGQYFENNKTIEAAVLKSRHKVTLHHQPNGIADIIKNCQIAVSAGGITLYELASFGVATVGIWLWENQRENVERLGQEGVVVPLAYEDGAAFDTQLFNAIEALVLGEKKRQKMCQKGQNLIDGGGAQRVATSIVELSK